MKIVVFGPHRRTGVLQGGEVVDLCGAFAKYLREREGERRPHLLADALAPSDLGRLIEGGRRALDNAAKALDHLRNAHDRNGANGESLVHKADAVTLHAPRARGARVACAGGNFADHSRQLEDGRGARSIEGRTSAPGR